MPWTYKPPFRFTAIFITGNISISSFVAVHGVQLRIINLFSVTAVLYFEPLSSRVRDWLNRLKFEFIVRVLHCYWSVLFK